MANVIGTDSDERLEGTSENDTINGNGGNDTLVAQRLSDRLLGGSGTDVAILPFERSLALWEAVDGGLRFRAFANHAIEVFVADDVEFVEFASGTVERLTRLSYADLAARAEPLGGTIDGDVSTTATAGSDVLFDLRQQQLYSGGDGSDIFLGGAVGREELGNYYDGSRLVGEDPEHGANSRGDRVVIDWSLFDGFNSDPGQAAESHEVHVRVLSYSEPGSDYLYHNSQYAVPAEIELTDTSGNNTFGVPVTGRLFLSGIEAVDFRGTTGNDTLTGGAGDDVIDGYFGNDLIFGNQGVNDLDGGYGDDTVLGGLYGHWNGGEGLDLLAADLSWAAEPIVYDARISTASQTWNAGQWNETRFSGFENFQINLTTGNDFFYSGAGKPNSDLNLILAGDGDDTIGAPDPGPFSYSESTLRGGQGTDTLILDYTTVSLGVGVRMTNLSGGNADITDVSEGFRTANVLDVAGFEILDFSGTSRNDRVYGGARADTLRGNGDNDTLMGNAGNDLLEGGDGNDLLRPGAGNDTVLGGLGNDTVELAEGEDSVETGEGNDSVTILGGIAALDSGGGNDVVNAGTTTQGHWSGGPGWDVLLGDFSAMTQAIVYDPQSGEHRTTDGSLRFESFETLSVAFGSGDDVIVDSKGGGNGEHLNAGLGDDTVTVALGGAFNATISGGEGADLLIIDAETSATGDYYRVDRIAMFGGDDGFLTDTAASIADVRAISFIGALNDQTYNRRTSTDGFERVSIAATEQNDSLFGGALSDTLIGNAGNDLLVGAGGIDSIDGGDGNDWVVAGTTTAGNWHGSAGIDLLEADLSALTAAVLYDAATGAHRSSDGAVQFTSFESLKLTLGSGDDFLRDLPGHSVGIGGLGNTTPAIDMGAGNDTLDISPGGMGRATIEGGDGEDLLILDASVPAPDDNMTVATVAMRDAAGNRPAATGSLADVGRIYFNGIVGLSQLSGFERVQISGTQNGDELFGGALSDTLIGNAGNDLLVGAGGIDSIDGGDGEDVVIAGTVTAGNWHGGNWADILRADLSGVGSAIRYDAATGEHRSEDGAVRFSSFETLQLKLGGADDYVRDLPWNGTNNAGGSTNTEIEMGGGNDTLWLSLGGLNRATVTGGTGEDRLIVDAATPPGGERYEVVRMRMLDLDGYIISEPDTDLAEIGGISYQARASDGRVYNQRMSLSEFESTEIVATNADDELLGGVGDDRLTGRGGNDLLGGGSGGTDTAVFGVASDTVTVRRLNDGTLQVGSDEGSDTLSGIDLLEFTDRTIAAMDFAAPTGALRIMGDGVEGATLRAAIAFSDAQGIGLPNWQWFRNDTEITGATGQDYRLTPADIGAAISVRVTYVDGFGMDEEMRATPTDAIVARATIDGTDAADRLDGTAAPERIEGRAGNDTLSGEGGVDHLDGGPGDDFVYGDGLKVALVLDVAWQVYRLYLATLAREPDMGGHLTWTQAIFEGASTPAKVAAGFVGSQEFQNTYGALDDPAFVELLYQNVLGRPSDPAGLQGWLNALAGGASRADVVLGFSDSREFQNTTQTDAVAWSHGHTDSNWSDDVFRLYGATLDRQPDLGGFRDWVGRLGSGTPFLTAIEGFTGSPEFQNTYGALDDAGFVSLLYRNVLDRAADAGGLADWLGRLGAGMTCAQVVEGFAQSREFINATAAPLMAWMRGQGNDDVLAGGAGANVLIGGLMSDTFVFDQSDGGSHRVLDLELWDSLRFDGFGYATAQEARAYMTQVGANVVFNDAGTMVTFVGADLSTMDVGMFV
ncbi:DUF4214 domain-containing protein [Mesobacterium sp. TK19101]|uniref:DUF4214 domain-containing protein n=1 Tax=Mesobacterium hydrothermale TaxID=3111907 RepID=A0ABU6HHI2_9RHOB|nr:DUF4214 domain-containing protein [Mesobacterium sp. TK19101]MEC3861234.1 DUF4214 domain-containing protein [Mesobacterium sp. TK19101]